MGSPSATRWWLVTAVAAAGVCLSVTDLGILSIALPAVRGDLAVPADEAAWIGTAFLLCQALLVPAGAWPAERCGLRRTQLIALALFAAFSLLVSQAWDTSSLIVFRTLQAVPGALVAVVATALLCHLVPPRRRTVALTGYGLCIVAASGLTPLVGGYLLDHGHTWRTIFSAEALVAVVVAVATRFAVPAVPGRRGRRFDVLGYLCLVTGLSTLLVGVSQGSRWGWTSYTVLILATVGVLVLALFVVVELEVDEPLIDLRAAGPRTFVGAVLLLDALVVGLSALWAPAQAAVDVHLPAGVGTVVAVAVALTRFLGRRAPVPVPPPPAAPEPEPRPELLPMLASRPAQVVAPGGRAGRGGTSLTHFACRSVGSRRDHGPDRS